MAEPNLSWQSKLVMLLVLPFAATHVTFACRAWLIEDPRVAIWTLGLSAVLGLATWKLRSATPAASLAGAAITASLMFSTSLVPYEAWHTDLLPVLAVAVLAALSTRAGRRRKEQLGTAEGKRGRSASQVAANLGVATLVSTNPIVFWLVDTPWLERATHPTEQLAAVALAALAEAAADTVSSEIGQIVGGKPRMITTLKSVPPGKDGAVSVAGTLAGAIASGIVAATGTWAVHGDWRMFGVSCASGVFGLLFDSLLGATLEGWGWLNNDAVNFLSTASAAAIALLLLSMLPAAA